MIDTLYIDVFFFFFKNENWQILNAESNSLCNICKKLRRSNLILAVT